MPDSIFPSIVTPAPRVKLDKWHGCLLWLLLSSVAAQAVVITPVPPNFVLDGKLGEWDTFEAAVKIGSSKPNGPGATQTIWMARSPKGLVVAGRNKGLNMQRGDPFYSAVNPHIEVWLFTAYPIELPPLTYTAKDCAALAPDERGKAACLEWIQEQIRFRKQITALFTRMWRISPYSAEEAHALVAFDALTESQRKAIGFPRPSGVPMTRFQTDPAGAVIFEMLIPWELFPPAGRLILEQVRFRVDFVTSGTADLSSGSTDFTADEGLPALVVSPPIVSTVTPCRQPLAVRNAVGEEPPAFYFLNNSLEVTRAYFFQNPLSGWRTLPRKGETSLYVGHQDFFAQEMDAGEYLCGPLMSYRKGTLVRQFSYWLGPERGQAPTKTPLTTFPVRRLADGTRLIPYGPEHTVYVASRRAWDNYSMKIFLLTPQLDVYEALSLFVSYDLPRGYEIEISPDGRTVKEFHETEKGWISESYCLKGYSYQRCGMNRNSLPPAKRILTER